MDETITQHIEMRPSAILGQKACIAGTRIRVQDVYVWHEIDGMSPHDIVAQFPQLSLADVHAAMAYYWDHREEIQTQMEAGQRAAEKTARDNRSKLAEKLSQRRNDGDALSSG